MRTVAQLAAIAAVLCTATEANAQWHKWSASADLDIDSHYVHAVDAGDGEERDGQGSFGLAARATGGKGVIHYAAGFGYRLGSSLPGGFIYSVELLPVGVGMVVSDRLRLAVRVGAGLSGVTSRLAFSGEWPVEARLDLRVTRWLAAGAFARVSWTTAESRRGGNRAIDFGDELRAGVRLRIGRHHSHGRRMRGNDGYYIAGLLTETAGTRFVGAAFGYNMDFTFGD